MIKFVFTCEHAGNLIPGDYLYYFNYHRELLKTHRGYDIGAFDVFKHFNEAFDYPSYYSVFSRMLIDLNRSLGSKNLFSAASSKLSMDEQAEIIRLYYKPYRQEVEDTISKIIKSGNKAYHISFHSFTPVLNGKTRNTDIGLLYNPQSPLEKEFCQSWKKGIKNEDSLLKVRFNYPYLGIADGFTTYLRAIFPKENYAGIELEINQKLLSYSKKGAVINALLNSFKKLKTTLS